LGKLGKTLTITTVATTITTTAAITTTTTAATTTTITTIITAATTTTTTAATTTTTNHQYQYVHGFEAYRSPSSNQDPKFWQFKPIIYLFIHQLSNFYVASAGYMWQVEVSTSWNAESKLTSTFFE
jgi:hypothetical protein